LPSFTGMNRTGYGCGVQSVITSVPRPSHLSSSDTDPTPVAIYCASAGAVSVAVIAVSAAGHRYGRTARETITDLAADRND
jgi:hypothetical protein